MPSQADSPLSLRVTFLGGPEWIPGLAFERRSHAQRTSQVQVEQMKISKAFLIAIYSMVFLCGGNAFADDHDRNDDHGGRKSEKMAAIAAPQTAKNDPTVVAECGTCHMVFPAHYLPTRSWQKLMAGLGDHFGVDASVDEATAKTILDWLTAHAADRSPEKRAKKINRSIPQDETPLRISDTKWFIKEHDEVSQEVWKRKSIGYAANCVACHTKAEAGSFAERDIKIPK